MLSGGLFVALPVLNRQAEQAVVLPFAVDLDVFFGEPFLGESELEQKFRAALVILQAAGVKAMQFQFFKTVSDSVM